MRLAKRMTALVVATFAGLPIVAQEYTYWPGFSERVSQVLWPLEPSGPDAPYVTLKIVMAGEPRAKPAAFQSAFHAVCQRHQGELLIRAKRLAPQSDWRVEVTFGWPVHQAQGVTVLSTRRQIMWLSTCRPVQDRKTAGEKK